MRVLLTAWLPVPCIICCQISMSLPVMGGGVSGRMCSRSTRSFRCRRGCMGCMGSWVLRESLTSYPPWGQSSLVTVQPVGLNAHRINQILVRAASSDEPSDLLRGISEVCEVMRCVQSRSISFAPPTPCRPESEPRVVPPSSSRIVPDPKTS